MRFKRVYSRHEREINHLWSIRASSVHCNSFHRCHFFFFFFSFFWRNPRFSFLSPPPFFSSTKSLQTPTSHWSPLRFCATASTHPLNRTCHGCACPLTKDNCDLDKHWGKHKGKGQVLFQFKCAPIHLQHNGDKEVAATSVSKGGHVIIRLMEEEEDADSTPDLDDNKKRREETTNQKEMR